SALALPDQDQTERAQRGTIAGPLDLADHEARCRPLDHAGALTDPEQSDREGDKAEDEKQFAHGTFLAGGGAPSVNSRLYSNIQQIVAGEFGLVGDESEARFRLGAHQALDGIRSTF